MHTFRQVPQVYLGFPKSGIELNPFKGPFNLQAMTESLNPQPFVEKYLSLGNRKSMAESVSCRQALNKLYGSPHGNGEEGKLMK